jgi:charged multivesicular body protein 2A
MTPAERLRKHQRALEKTQRELDRERVKLENQEKKLITEIKKSAKAGQMGAAKIQAKDLVRTRRSDLNHHIQGETKVGASLWISRL